MIAMAKETKTGVEAVYTINLRRSWLKEPRSKRSNRAIREIRGFVTKHTKSKEVKISKGVNELVFSHGFKKPPGKIKVEVKGDFESVQVKIPGEVIEQTKQKARKTGIEGLKDRLTGKEKKEALEKAIQKKVDEQSTKENVEKIVEKIKKQEASEKKEENKGFKEKKEKK